MTREKVMSVAESLVFYAMIAVLILMLGSTVGCEFTKEVVLDPNGVPTGVERVVVEGPGGDMVGVGVETVRRLAPLLPEPWNTLISALIGGFTVGTAGWVFRSRKEKKEKEANA